MVAQLDGKSMQIVVNGADGRSRGLVTCELAPRPGPYDHKRHHALKEAKKPQLERLPVWDFVLHRESHTALRLHPQWNSREVECYRHAGHFLVPQVPPEAGLGKSDGPGTYKKYKQQGTLGDLKLFFDRPKDCDGHRNEAAVADGPDTWL